MNNDTKEKIKRIAQTLTEGERVRIVCDCKPEGSKSVIITGGKRPGGFCFRCKQGTEWRETHVSRGHRQENRPARKDRQVPDCALTGIKTIADWPPIFRTWASMITQEEATQYGIEYVPDVDGLKFPTMTGCTWRKMSPKRYLANYDKGDVFLAGDKFNHVWVLVEDPLSAIVVGRHACAVAMMGTSIHDKGLALLAHYKPELVLVWTDNDNPQVRQAARKIARKVQALALRTKIVTDFPGKDPKELGDKEIHGKIYELSKDFVVE